MLLLMHDIGGSEGEDNLPRMKRTRRFSLTRPKKLQLRALRCSGAANSYEHVVKRSLLLIILRAQNQIRKIRTSGHLL